MRDMYASVHNIVSIIADWGEPLTTHSITASKIALPYPPSISAHSLDHDRGVPLSVHSIKS